MQSNSIDLPFAGLADLKSFKAEKYLKKIGIGKEDHYFWKQVGKAVLCTYAVLGAVWMFKETSPLDWWTTKRSPNEEKEMQDKKFEQEALKMWLRMKNEVVSELQEKGFDVE